MNSYDVDKTSERPFSQDLWSAARHYLGSHTGIIAMAAVALGAGAYFNWGWLVAAGIAPLLLTTLPCVAMCALGLCMKGGSKSPGDVAAPHGDAAGDVGQSPTLRLSATDERADAAGEVTAGKADAAGEAKNQERVTSRNRKGCC